jgi:sec-independent protein translocase protein TatC
MTPSEPLTLIDHIRELRRRVIWSAAAILLGTMACYWFYDRIVVVLMRPFHLGQPGVTALYINSLFEGFATKIRFSVIAGVMITIPIHLYHLIRFVLPGLSHQEQKVVGWALFSSAILSAISLYLGYFYFIPSAIRVLTGNDFIPKGVGLLLNFNQNVFYVVNFLLYGMLTFQLPILLEILLYLNVLSRKTLLRHSRFAILVIFIISAIVTPTPDVINQLFIAVPLLLFYFSALLIAYIFKFGEG